MRQNDKQSDFIDVANLRVGHYIYLDVGWMGHPFALNSFRISSEDQIATIRGLGLERLRFSPAQSRLPEEAPGNPAAEATVSLTSKPEDKSGEGPSTPNAETSMTAEAASPAATAPAAPSPLTPKELRREQIARQHAALQRCENQFNDAAHTYRAIVEGIYTHTLESREQGEAIVDGMISQMGAANEEILVRLLSEKAGERTSLHSINVTIISLLLARATGSTPEHMRDIGLGALLHDIGKMELPDRLRWSDSEVSDAEKSLYRSHVGKGVVMAQKLGLPDGAKLIIAQHHELSDGSGYPKSLHNESIYAPARIVALVNRYDNLCNPGNPAQAVTPHEALSLIYAQNRNQYDARVMAVFIRLMGVYPPGSVIELSTGRHALVVSVNSARPLRPNVIIHDPSVPADEALIMDLESNPEIGIRRSIKPLQLPKAAYDYLSPRKRLCYFFERGSELGSVPPCP
ncbi:MAG: DUF3391 domain-containing protein [Rhodocyclaceae bacterium]|jgi:putative nucleotidyltransferase with HDIG domain|nr:DUF3391 domain-containing protein [Rhodocyclaceae bacterium]